MNKRCGGKRSSRSPERHLAAVTEHLISHGAHPRRETVPIGQALGRVLAEPVVACWDSPRFDNSQMDGYALSDDHLGSLNREFMVGPYIPAGTDPAELYPDGLGAPAKHSGAAADGPGPVAPIMTGARIPQGAVAVVPVEACDPPEFLAVRQRIMVPSIEPGTFIRRAGSDLPAGSVVLEAGCVVNPQGVAVLASQGISEVPVWARPRILLCTGGDEVAPPGTEPDAHQVPDANAPLLRAMCVQYGIEITAGVTTGDRVEDFLAQLREAIAVHRPDLVVTSGGISQGKYEVVRRALGEGTREESGPGKDVPPWFGQVAQQPGGPQGLASCDGLPVIALPGNPISTMVSFRLFVIPALVGIWRHATVLGPREARVLEPTEGLPGKTQFRRARLEPFIDEGRNILAVRPIGGPGSHLLAQAVEADCLLEVPPGARLQTGDTATIYPLAPSC